MLSSRYSWIFWGSFGCRWQGFRSSSGGTYVRDAQKLCMKPWWMFRVFGVEPGVVMCLFAGSLTMEFYWGTWCDAPIQSVFELLVCWRFRFCPLCCAIFVDLIISPDQIIRLTRNPYWGWRIVLPDWLDASVFWLIVTWYLVSEFVIDRSLERNGRSFWNQWP